MKKHGNSIHHEEENYIVCDILLNYLKVYDKIACDIKHLQ